MKEKNDLREQGRRTKLRHMRKMETTGQWALPQEATGMASSWVYLMDKIHGLILCSAVT